MLRGDTVAKEKSDRPVGKKLWDQGHSPDFS
jgi:hypothetical protein